MLLKWGHRAVQGQKKSNPYFSAPPWISVLRLTRVGSDIARVLPFHADAAYFDFVLKSTKQQLSENGRVEWATQDEEIWTAV